MLTSIGKEYASFDPKQSKIHIDTRTLRTYVISSRALSRTLAEAANQDDILRFGYAEDLLDVEESTADTTAAQTEG
jgi:hypothetical protein